MHTEGRSGDRTQNPTLHSNKPNIDIKMRSSSQQDCIRNSIQYEMTMAETLANPTLSRLSAANSSVASLDHPLLQSELTHACHSHQQVDGKMLLPPSAGTGPGAKLGPGQHMRQATHRCCIERARAVKRMVPSKETFREALHQMEREGIVALARAPDQEVGIQGIWMVQVRAWVRVQMHRACVCVRACVRERERERERSASRGSGWLSE